MILGLVGESCCNGRSFSCSLMRGQFCPPTISCSLFDSTQCGPVRFRLYSIFVLLFAIPLFSSTYISDKHFSKSFFLLQKSVTSIMSYHSLPLLSLSLSVQDFLLSDVCFICCHIGHSRIHFIATRFFLIPSSYPSTLPFLFNRLQVFRLLIPQSFSNFGCFVLTHIA